MQSISLTAKTGQILMRNYLSLFLKDGDALKIITLRKKIMASNISRKTKRTLLIKLNNLLRKHLRAAKEENGILTEREIQEAILKSEEHE